LGCHEEWGGSREGRSSAPAIQAGIEVQPPIQAVEEGMIAMMDGIAYRYEHGGIAVTEIWEHALRDIIERVEGLKLHLESAIQVVNRLLGINFE
jgi:hypothetical protein